MTELALNIALSLAFAREHLSFHDCYWYTGSYCLVPVVDNEIPETVQFHS